MSKGRKPDYVIGVINKVDEKEKGQVGAAWINKDGSISIRLNPAVVLTSSKYYINLFPKDGSNLKKGSRQEYIPDAPFQDEPPPIDDDTPF